MKKKTNPIAMFVMIAVIGLLIPILNGDFEIGSFFEGLEINQFKDLLDILNIGLAFLALGGIVIFLFVRAAKDDKTYYWDFLKDQNKDEE
jgi:hypothetical protein